jgi:hypothetical protein
MQLVIEELVIHKLLVLQADPVAVTITIGYSEKTGEIELSLTYPGQPYDPLAQIAADDLPVLLVRSLVKSSDCRHEGGISRLRLAL